MQYVSPVSSKPPTSNVGPSQTTSKQQISIRMIHSSPTSSPKSLRGRCTPSQRGQRGPLPPIPDQRARLKQQPQASFRGRGERSPLLSPSRGRNLYPFELERPYKPLPPPPTEDTERKPSLPLLSPNKSLLKKQNAEAASLIKPCLSPLKKPLTDSSCSSEKSLPTELKVSHRPQIPEKPLPPSPPSAERATTPNNGDVEGFWFKKLIQAREEGNAKNQLASVQQLGKYFIKKKDYVRAAHLFNGALSLSIQCQFESSTQNSLLAELENIEESFFRTLGIRIPEGYKGNIDLHRSKLKQIREKARKQQKKNEEPEKIQKEITKGFCSLLKDLFNEGTSLLGNSPIYAIMGLGSMSREEMCPFSDIEFAFLVEDDTLENRDYFRKLSQIIELKTINLGETEFPIIPPRKVGKHFIERESLTPNGFSIDIGGLSPRGKDGVYELIGSPECLASFQKPGWLQRNQSEVILVNSLTSPIFVYGKNTLIQKYEKLINTTLGKRELLLIGRTLRQQRAIELLKEHIREFKPYLEEERIHLLSFNVKKDFYRPVQMVIGGLAIYYGINKKNTLEIVKELEKKKVFTKENSEKIQGVIKTALNWRIKTHLFYQKEEENLSYTQEGTEDFDLSLNCPITQEDIKTIREIYQVLFPLQQQTIDFVNGKRKPFSSPLHDDKIGQVIPLDNKRILLNENLSSYTYSLALNPTDFDTAVGLHDIYYRLGDLQKSFHLLEHRLAVLKSQFKGVPNPHEAVVLKKLGDIYQSLGKPHKALEYFSRSFGMIIQLKIDTKHFLPSLSLSLGNTYFSLGKIEDAIQSFGCLLDQNLVVDSSTKIAALYGMGNAYSNRGDLKNGVEYVKQGFEIAQKEFANDLHTMIVQGMIVLGRLTFNNGDHQQGLKLLEGALSRSKMQKSKFYSEIAVGALTNLGDFHQKLGNIQKAVGHYLEALQICSQDLCYQGNEIEKSPCPSYGFILNNLCIAYSKSGQLKKAQEAGEKALAIFEKKEGYELKTGTTLSNLACIYRGLGNHARAAAFSKRAVSYFDPNHPSLSLAAALNNLAENCAAMGDFSQAILYLEQALSVMRNFSSHPYFLTILLNVGTIYSNADKNETAIPFFLEAIELLSKNNREAEKIAPLAKLAACYADLKDFDQVNRYLAEAKEILGMEGAHLDIALALNNVGAAYLEQEKLEKAVEFFKQALRMQTILYQGKPHHLTAQVLYHLANAHDGNLSAEYYQKYLSMGSDLYGNQPIIQMGKAHHVLGILLLSDPKIINNKQSFSHFESALSIYNQLPQSPKNKKVIYQLLSLLRGKDSSLDPSKCISHTTALIALHKQMYPDQLDELIKMYKRLADLYSNCEQIKKSNDCIETALSILDQKYQCKDIESARLIDIQALNFMKLDRSPEGVGKTIKRYKDSMKIRKDLLSPHENLVNKDDKFKVFANEVVDEILVLTKIIAQFTNTLLQNKDKAVEECIEGLMFFREIKTKSLNFISEKKSLSELLEQLQMLFLEIPLSVKTSLLSRHQKLLSYYHLPEVSGDNLEKLDRSSMTEEEIIARLLSMDKMSMEAVKAFYEEKNSGKALKLFNQVLADWRSLRGEESHILIVHVHAGIGRVYSQSKQFTKAVQHQLSAITHLTKILEREPSLENRREMAFQQKQMAKIASCSGCNEQAIQAMECGIIVLKSVLADGYKDQQQIKVDILQFLESLGGFYCLASNFEEKAIAVYEEALCMQCALFGENNTIATNLLSDLVRLYKKNGNLKKVEEYEKRLIPLRDKKYCSSNKEFCLAVLKKDRDLYKNEPHIEVVKSLKTVGAFCFGLREYEEAILYYNEALEMGRKLTKEEYSLDIAGILNNMGSIYAYSLKKYPEAINVYKESCLIYQKIFSDQANQDHLYSLSGLTHAYEMSEKYLEALEYARTEMKIREEVLAKGCLEFGNPNKELAQCKKTMSRLYQKLKNFNEALCYELGVLEFFKEFANGKPSEDVAFSLKNLFSIYREIKVNNVAVTYAEMAIKEYNRLDGLSSFHLSEIFFGLVSIYSELDDEIKQFEYMLKFLEVTEKFKPEQSIELSIMKFCCQGYIKLKEKKYVEAIELYKQSLSMIRSYCADHPDQLPAMRSNRIDSLNCLGFAYTKTKKFNESVKTYQKSLCLNKQIHGDNPHINIVKNYVEIGAQYFFMKKIKEGIDYLKKALEMSKKLPSESQNETINVLISLGFLYCKSNDYSSAVQSYQQALSIAKDDPKEPNSPKCVASVSGLSTVYLQSGNLDPCIRFSQEGLEMLNQQKISTGKAKIHKLTLLGNMGIGLSKKGKYQEALDKLRAAAEMVQVFQASGQFKGSAFPEVGFNLPPEKETVLWIQFLQKFWQDHDGTAWESLNFDSYSKELKKSTRNKRKNNLMQLLSPTGMVENPRL